MLLQFKVAYLCVQRSLAGIFLATLTLPIAATEIPFSVANPIGGSFGGALSVEFADLDNDGDLDAVANVAIDDDIAWWENDGSPVDGGWTEHELDAAV